MLTYLFKNLSFHYAGRWLGPQYRTKKWEYSKSSTKTEANSLRQTAGDSA